MPQKVERLEDDPLFKTLSPEDKISVYYAVYGEPYPPEGTTKAPKIEVKPYKKSLLENFRDWSLKIPIPGAQRIPPLENRLITTPGLPTESERKEGVADIPLNYRLEDYRPLPKPSDIAYFDLPVGGKAMMEELPQAMGLGVGAIGASVGPGTAVGGYGLGTLGGMAIRRDLQRNAPELFGEPTFTEMPLKGATPLSPAENERSAFFADLMEDAPGHAINALFPLAKLAIPGKLGAPARERAKAYFLRSWYKDKLTPDQRAALQADPSFKFTAGQAARSEVKENTYQNPAKQDFVAEQSQYITDEGKRLIDEFSKFRDTPKKKGEAAAYELSQFEESRRGVRESLRNQIEAAGAPNTAYFNWDSKKKSWVESTVPGNAPTQKRVDSPIRLTRTSEYADDALAHLDSLTQRFKDTPIAQTGEIGRIKRYLTGFTGTGKEKKLNVEPFKVVEDARDALDELIHKTASHGEANKTLLNLRDNLDQDIQNSIRRWGSGSLDKFKELKDAITFDRGVLGQDVLASARKDPSQFFKGAYKDEETARRYALSTRVAQEVGGKYSHIKGADNPMAANYLQGYLDKFGGDFFRGKQARKQFIQDFEKNIPQQFMNAEQTQQLKHFFEKAAIPKPVTAIGAYSLEQGKSSMWLKIPGIRQVAIISNSEFAKRVLMDPKATRIAAKLLEMPKDSAAAKTLTRSLYTIAKLGDVGELVSEEEAMMRRKGSLDAPSRGSLIGK